MNYENLYAPGTILDFLAFSGNNTGAQNCFYGINGVAQACTIANHGNDYGANIGSPATFGHPIGFINPSSTTTPRSLWGEFGFRFTF